MNTSRIARLAALATIAAMAGTAGAAADPAAKAPPAPQWAQLQTRQLPNPAARDGDEGEDPMEVAEMAEQYAEQRSLPADSVSAAALVAARAQAAAMPAAQARASEITDVPTQGEPPGYTDPAWSNAGSGFQLIAGRMTALAVDRGAYYAGAADGGVWKSTDGGRHWAAIWEHMPTLSIGAITVAKDRGIWVGTGEANTSSDSYQGVGVYRSTNAGGSFQRVGGNELMSHLVFRLLDDGHGTMYAATSQGLYRHSSTSSAGAWKRILKPDPNPTNSPYNTSFITDVVVRGGGRQVIAALGWRNGTDYNGFYVSNSAGAAGSFRKIRLTGDIDGGDIGRTTFAVSANGNRLYAMVQSPEMLAAGEDSMLRGIYVSDDGSPAGPWHKVAGANALMNSGSALTFDGYHPGVQAWYNQFLLVDPADAKHVYAGLEEVYETRDGGRTWSTISPYWNYGLACGANCPKTTHPDQHAIALHGSTVVVGNDGGVYSRPMSHRGYGAWTSLNNSLHTLQYYDAAAGNWGAGGTAYWGGLQDNGTTLLRPGKINVEPAGGDGGTVLVDPANAQRAVGEYVGLLMYRTSDGGHSFTNVSPVCGNGYTGADCDPAARFIAPFQADVRNTNTWVAAGSRVWRTTKGWNTNCLGATCDWKAVHTFGTDAAGGPRLGTALAANGAVTYAAWVDSSGNPGPTFATGIDTNYGGHWHRVVASNLPNRFIAGLTVDPANPAHVYAVFNGYSRRWIPGGGTGVIFESTNGGRTWRNITGNLPDAPGNGVAMVSGNLYLGTDVGVFIAKQSDPAMWRRVPGLTNSAAVSVRPVPGANAAVVGTHGRGIWRVGT